MIGILVNVDSDWRIVPHWHNEDSMRRLRTRARGGAFLVMGRVTWEGFGAKLPALPNGRIVILSSLGLRCHTPSWGVAMLRSGTQGNTRNTWFVGGASVLAMALVHGRVTIVDVTVGSALPEEARQGAPTFQHEAIAGWRVTTKPMPSGYERRIYTKP